jgi:peroxiredoxin
MPLVHTPTDELGSECPKFELPGTDGKIHAHSEFKKDTPFLVMFICNHCPYVIAIEERLVQLGRDLQSARIPVIAISSNDAQKYPEDSFEKMKLKKFPFPYLFDESQEVARRFGAVCTPDFFVFGRSHKLAYRGRLDDNWKDPAKVTRRELYQAIMDLAAGKEISLPQTPSMGCSMKWKELE